MNHVAIMRKSWGLLPRILAGQKTIESRWYSSRTQPWDTVHPGDVVYFKDSGYPVTVRASVSKVLQFEDLTPEKVRDILARYGAADGIKQEERELFYERFKNKKYCILVFLKDPRLVEPFAIDKTGFGTMSAWLTVSNISKIKK